MTSNSPPDPFTDYAPAYDREFSSLPAVKRLRTIVRERALEVWTEGSEVLELGCGTGEDAAWFLQRGIGVLATDPSPGMICQTRSRFSREGIHAETMLMSAADVSRFEGRTFDGIFSNFGALNCVCGLPRLFAPCARLLRPGGTMIFCLLNPFPLWEMAAFALRGNFRKMFRRASHHPIPVKVYGGYVTVRYYRVAALLRAARPFFRVQRIQGLNCISPPPGYTAVALRHPGLVRRLEGLEDLAMHWPLLSRLGDHVLLVLQKSTGVGP